MQIIMDKLLNLFSMDNKVVVITGGAGLLGIKHAEAVAAVGGIPVILDIDEVSINETVNIIKKSYNCKAMGLKLDITSKLDIENGLDRILSEFNRVDAVINNAANNPKMINMDGNINRFEHFPTEIWNEDILVGLTGAFLCSQVFGSYMASNKAGVLLNISSDLGIIAPDQRIYKKPDLQNSEQPTKPVTYSVIKHGIIGLTKYLSTYWAEDGVRVNSLCPGGVYNNQDEAFVAKLTNLIPMGRMGHVDEYKAAVIFLISDASSYMTGSTLVIDGGRSCW